MQTSRIQGAKPHGSSMRAEHAGELLTQARWGVLEIGGNLGGSYMGIILEHIAPIGEPNREEHGTGNRNRRDVH